MDQIETLDQSIINHNSMILAKYKLCQLLLKLGIRQAKKPRLVIPMWPIMNYRMEILADEQNL